MDAAAAVLPAPNQHIRRHQAPRRLLLALPVLVLGVGYLLTRAPQPTFVTPQVAGRVALTQPLTINFSLPVSRTLRVELSPSVEGQVSFGRALLQDHLVRSVTFTPAVTWKADTTYTLTLSSVDSAIPGVQQSAVYDFTFTTAALPTVQAVSPSTSETLTADSAWRVTLDRPNDPTARFGFETDPALPVTTELTSDGVGFVVKPDQLLPQGQAVALRVLRTEQQLAFGTTEVAKQSDAVTVASYQWQVRTAAGVQAVTPQGRNVPLGQSIQVKLSEATTLADFTAAATLTPSVSGTWAQTAGDTFTFTHEAFAQATTYTLNLAKTLRTQDGGFLENAVDAQFTTVGPVRVTSSSPTHDSAGVNVRSPLHVTFDQPVDQAAAEQHFSILPKVAGTTSWDNSTFTFTPAKALTFDTTYTLTFTKGVAGTAGFPSVVDLQVRFATEHATTRLAVPFHRQDHNLSCEAATLVMALRYRGVNIGEQTLIEAIGFDPTPKKDGVWGDPDVAFVGNIDGQQPGTGYGVYAAPVAKAGSAYRKTRNISGGSLTSILTEVKAGNPVIVWGNTASGRRIDWKTPTGKSVLAIVGEHTRVVIGFVGSVSNPTTIITLDPLYGERRFSKAAFLADWALLGNMAVVVE